MLAFIHLIADGEALMLAKKGWLNLDLAWQAIAASSVNSFVHETEGQLILNVSYDIGFTIELALKNLGFVSQFSKDLACHLSELIRSNRFLKREKKTYGGEA